MEDYVTFLSREQLYREMLVIKEAIRDAIKLKTQNPEINFCIENAHNNLNIVAKEYKNRH